MCIPKHLEQVKEYLRVHFPNYASNESWCVFLAFVLNFLAPVNIFSEELQSRDTIVK